MGYEVLARKWRPQRFEDVVGQEHVTRTLANAIRSGRIAHAYLLVGPRGIGKTSVARIFAKALRCEQGPTVTPCDKCDSCREIMAGTSLDVLEIDGASNNGVEQVRELRETVKYAPSRGAFKVYIIDEVHMLSVAAFNALLKTLEEPPAHVKFVFATTEPERVLATIVSRCQRFDLRRISVPLIVERLKLICGQEKIEADDDALLAIARGAQGGLRDAESALDQLVSFKGEKIVEQDVLSVFGLVSRAALEDLAANVLGGGIADLIRGVDELDESGKDLRRVTVELMEHFRNLLVSLHVEDVAGALDLTPAQCESLRRQAGGTDTEKVLRVVDILGEAQERMRHALSKRTLLETALIRCARAASVVSLEDVLARLQDAGGADAGTGPASPTSGDGLYEGGEKPKRRTAGRTVRERRQSAPAPAASATREAGDLPKLVEQWHEIAERVGKIAVLARSSLLDARPVRVEDDRVIVAMDPEFAGEARNLEMPRNRRALEQVLRQVLGRRIGAEIVLQADGNHPPETPQPAQPERSGEKTEATGRDEWEKNPTVAKVCDMFNGRIVDVRE